MQHTSNYNLNKPSTTDYAKIEALNENADIIDAKLKELDSNKANNNSMTELQQEFTKHLDDYLLHTPYVTANWDSATSSYVIDMEGLTEYKEGLSFAMKVTATNTDSANININGIGKKGLWGQFNNGGNIPSGQISLGFIYTVRYAGGYFLLQGGGLKLNNTLTSTSKTEAATANAVKMVNDKFTPENWIPAVLSMGTQDTTYPISYFKDSFGIVHIQGVCRVDASGMLAFTVPVGYRPSINMAVGILQSTTPLGYKTLNIQTNGYFTAMNFTASSFATLNFSYRAGA